MKTPQSLLYEQLEKNVIKEIDKSFDECISKNEYSELYKIQITVPKDWDYEKIQIAKKYLKEYNWDVIEDVEREYINENGSSLIRKLVLYPMKVLTREEELIQETSRISLLSENIKIDKDSKKSIKITNEKDRVYDCYLIKEKLTEDFKKEFYVEITPYQKEKIKISKVRELYSVLILEDEILDSMMEHYNEIKEAVDKYIKGENK